MLVNLDKLSADYSQRILELVREKVKDGEVSYENVEKICNSALGILKEQGIYSCILFLLSKSGSETEKSNLSGEEFVACGIIANFIDILNTEELKNLGCTINIDFANYSAVNGYKSELLQKVRDVLCSELKKMLLIKSLYEQILIYTRYGAKAIGE